MICKVNILLAVFLGCLFFNWHHASAIRGRSAEINEISPIDYGAKANDLDDDSSAFQKCLDKAKQLNGSRIIIPPGRFIIASELTIDGTNNLIIEGNGAILVKPSDNDSNIFYGNYNKQITIRDLVFEGNRKKAFREQWPHRMNACAIIGKSSGIRFENCIVKDFHYGVCLGTSTDNGYDVWVVNCQFYNCNSDIDLYGKPAVHIIGNSSHNCTGHSIQIEPPYKLELGYYDYRDQPQIDALSVGNTISNNIIAGCEGIGIVIFGGCEDITISNNQIINYGEAGIFTHDDSSNIIICDNIISNSLQKKKNDRPWTSNGAGILVSKIKSVIVIGNIINHANTGIYLAGTSDALISNNDIVNSKDSGVCIYNATRCLLNGNFINQYNLSSSWWGNSGIVIYHSTDICISETMIVDTGKDDYGVSSIESERVSVSNSNGYGYKKSFTYPESLAK